MEWVVPCLCLSWYFPDPLETDLPRFPCTVAQKNWEFAHKFLDRLDDQIALGGVDPEELGAIRVEARFLERCWDALDNATRPHCHDDMKRSELVRLRFLLGEENYAKGFMPPFVPVWCLPRLDR